MTKARFPDAHLLSCFTNLIFMQLLLAVRHGNGKSHFDVIGPDGPILAIVGKDMELPCHLSPNISAENMELRWYRDHFSPAVYLYQKGKDVSEEQMEEYWGRTVLVRDHITKGKAAVKIRGVTLFDNGTYRCQFKDGTFFAEATLWIKVAGLGLQPRISLRDDEDESLLAKCTSTSWYPEPQVEWRDFEGKPIPSVTNLSVSATSGLFSVVSSVMIKEMATEGLSCSIVNPLLLEKKAAEIYVPAAFSRKHQSTAWSIVLPLILMTLALIVAAALCIFGKRQRERNRQMLEEIRKRAEEEQRRPASTNGWRMSNPTYGESHLCRLDDDGKALLLAVAFMRTAE
ncbi:butyrophilin-like protein 10 [Rhynchocyon petersi]